MKVFSTDIPEFYTTNCQAYLDYWMGGDEYEVTKDRLKFKRNETKEVKQDGRPNRKRTGSCTSNELLRK